MIKMTWIKRCLMLLLAYCLAACASNSGSAWNPPYPGERDFFPGGVGVYSFGGGGISKEHFQNIEIAQSAYSPYQKDRTWLNDRPSNTPSATLLGLNAYYPLHVRWKLKDGREFMLENIDIRAIMREYFKTNKQTIQLQWQRERRPWEVGDDQDATLIHDIKDDTLILKWNVTLNLTPSGKRLQPNGAANKWIFKNEQYVITTIPGVPTQGLNFNERWEFNRPVKSVK